MGGANTGEGRTSIGAIGRVGSKPARKLGAENPEDGPFVAPGIRPALGASPFMAKADAEKHYDAYRCCTCSRLFTKLEMFECLKSGVLNCGHGRVNPTNILWYHFFLPRVLKFAVLRILGKA